jgi:hypothetical protein
MPGGSLAQSLEGWRHAVHTLPPPPQTLDPAQTLDSQRHAVHTPGQLGPGAAAVGNGATPTGVLGASAPAGTSEGHISGGSAGEGEANGTRRSSSQGANVLGTGGAADDGTGASGVGTRPFHKANTTKAIMQVRRVRPVGSLDAQQLRLPMKQAGGAQDTGVGGSGRRGGILPRRVSSGLV